MCAMISRACQEFTLHIGRLHGSTKAYRSDSAVTFFDSGPTCNSTASGYRRKSVDPRCPRCSIGTSKPYIPVYPYTSLYVYVLSVGMEYPPGLAGTFMAGSRACQQHSHVQDCKKPSSAVVIGNPVQSSRPTKGTPRQMPRRQGREATTPTNCRIIQSRSKCYPHLLASHQVSASSVERQMALEHGVPQLANQAYVSMTSFLSSRDNGDGQTAMWWHLRYRMSPLDGILQISDAEVST